MKDKFRSQQERLIQRGRGVVIEYKVDKTFGRSVSLVDAVKFLCISEVLAIVKQCRTSKYDWSSIQSRAVGFKLTSVAI
jgi:hypothetical protein